MLCVSNRGIERPSRFLETHSLQVWSSEDSIPKLSSQTRTERISGTGSLASGDGMLKNVEGDDEPVSLIAVSVADVGWPYLFCSELCNAMLMTMTCCIYLPFRSILIQFSLKNCPKKIWSWRPPFEICRLPMLLLPPGPLLCRQILRWPRSIRWSISWIMASECQGKCFKPRQEIWRVAEAEKKNMFAKSGIKSRMLLIQSIFHCVILKRDKALRLSDRIWICNHDGESQVPKQPLTLAMIKALVKDTRPPGYFNHGRW